MIASRAETCRARCCRRGSRRSRDRQATGEATNGVEGRLNVEPPREETTTEKVVFTNCAFQTSVCQGDSGGPFVCLNNENKALLTGIVSFGSGCAYAGYYGVYARVTKILGWIESNLVSFRGDLVRF